jgi:hypothetical protein
VSAADYKVVVKDANGTVVAQAAGVDVAPAAMANIEVEITHQSVGEMKLTATIECAKDENTTNNTAVHDVNVVAKGSKFVQIGNGDDEFLVCPASFMSHQSVSQTLYYAEEIGVENGFTQYGEALPVSTRLVMQYPGPSEIPAGPLPLLEVNR